MATNFSGPFILKVFYVETALSFGGHVVNFNVDVVANDDTPGLTFEDYTVQTRSQGAIDLDTATEALLALIADLLSSAVTIGPCELWRNDVTDQGGGVFTQEQVFYSSYTPTENVGTGGAGTIPNTQLILTARSQEGGIYRFELLDNILTASPEFGFPSPNTPSNTLMSFLTGAGGFVLAKDTSYPQVGLRYLPGFNEALFKKRNRQSQS